jgi:Ca2+-binding RTX toxin-like protein
MVVVGAAVAALALGAAASSAGAAVTLTESCGVFGCAATVTGVAGGDALRVLPNPNDADGTRIVGTASSATDPWSLPGGCAQAGDTTARTIDCTTGWAIITINAGSGDDTILSLRDLPVIVNGQDGNDTIAQLLGTPANGLTASGDADDDTLTGADAVDSLDGGAGNDALSGGAGGDSLTGGDGGDVISGGGGGDSISGGAGRDSLTPGLGADGVQGGDGVDKAVYAERLAAVAVTLDDQANDGESGELDNVRADVEDVVGGRGNDQLTGSAAANVLEGRGGNDGLAGAGGRDALDGGEGDDALSARDGIEESLQCGAGTDSAVGDQIDALSDCEASSLTTDADGDGVAPPADCNDANSAIRPNAGEVADNNVDENCDGADAVSPDRDGDGSSRPADCDDANAAVKPGAREIPGNPVDEDCSGVADPFATLKASVRAAFGPSAAATRLTRLRIRNLPAGARVAVTCRGKGKGCPRKPLRKTIAAATKVLAIPAPFAGRALQPGARLEVRITKAETIGRVFRYTMRKGRKPATQSLCLAPGAKKAIPC